MDLDENALFERSEFAFSIKTYKYDLLKHKFRKLIIRAMHAPILIYLQYTYILLIIYSFLLHIA